MSVHRNCSCRYFCGERKICKVPELGLPAGGDRALHPVGRASQGTEGTMRLPAAEAVAWAAAVFGPWASSTYGQGVIVGNAAGR